MKPWAGAGFDCSAAAAGVSENMIADRHKFRLPRLLAGWLALCLYVFALSPIGFVAAAVLGELDSDHHALIQSGENGPQLVLRHDSACVGHRHHAVARALTLFAGPVSPTNPDHVLQFSAATGLLRESPTVAAVVKQSPPVAPCFVAPVALSGADRILWIPLGQPPPVVSENLLNICSTVFLI